MRGEMQRPAGEVEERGSRRSVPESRGGGKCCRRRGKDGERRLPVASRPRGEDGGAEGGVVARLGWSWAGLWQNKSFFTGLSLFRVIRAIRVP